MFLKVMLYKTLSARLETSIDQCPQFHLSHSSESITLPFLLYPHPIVTPPHPLSKS